MNRWFLFFGIVAAYFFVYQFGTGGLTVNEVYDRIGYDEIADEAGNKSASGAGDIANKNPVEKLQTSVIPKNKTTISQDKNLEDENLTILAFGDIMLGRYVRVLMDLKGKDYVFSGMPENFLEGYDVIFGNLEGPIKGAGRKGGTSMVFSFNEDIAQFLKNWGFNLVSIANNHAVDQGWEGRKTTIEALNNAKLGWCGHPSETDPSSVYYGKAGDKKFAFVCFQDITFNLNDEAAVKLIKEIHPNVDYLIVSVHWGYEYKHTPDLKKQVHPGRAFIDAGADAVIGHHPHVVQSFEVYRGHFIFYSLGNFVFDQYWSKDTQEELALGIELDDTDDRWMDGESFKTTVYLYPMKSSLSQSRLMNNKERAEWIERFIKYGVYDEKMKEMIREGVIEAK